ncbi:hypothetical protein D3C81_2011780 [compost metagenome]
MLVVTDHLPRTFHQDLAIFGNAAFNARQALTDITNAHASGATEMRASEVFRHTVTVQQLKAELAIPVDDRYR